MNTILLPGGLGYIGSHTVMALLPLIKDLPARLHIIDNLSNSSETVLEKLQAIATSQLGYDQAQFKRKVSFQCGDILDRPFLKSVLGKLKAQQAPVDTIIHFAAKKAVFQSTQKPLDYYETNVVGSLHLLQCVQEFGVKNFIFSSSASVYGNGGNCTQESPLGAMSPYGDTKHMVQIMMKGMGARRPDKTFLALRYFNPVGAHHSALIGDQPLAPNNLFPVIEQVVQGKRPKLFVFGNDYDTVDGSGVRDYIHIQDLAEGHAAAYLKVSELKGYQVINLGTGSGMSVLQVVQMYQRVNGIKFEHQVVSRRAGDVGSLIALVGRAKTLLEWQSKRTMEQACADSYRFITRPK